MHPLAMNWKKTWVMGALLAIVLFGAGRPGAAREPFRPAAFDEGQALVGFWLTLETDEHGAFRPLGLMLKDDGRFMLEVTDAKGKLVDRVQGSYTYAESVLTLTADGKAAPYTEVKVEFADDALNLRKGGKMSHWVKDLARRD